MADLQAAINKLAARQTRVVRAADAHALVRAARRLSELPEVEAAFASGELTAAHVAVVTSAVTPARVATAEDNGISLAVTDHVLAAAARGLGPEDTAKAVRRWVAGVDPDGVLADAADLDRRFTMAVSLAGRVHLGGHLDPVGAETVHAALEAIMNGDRPPGDLRSHSQRQGDALVEVCRRALVSGDLPDVRGERPQVRVTIDWWSLCSAAGAAGMATGELPFAGPITPETARRLACDANVVRVITGPDGLPLDEGRSQRTATAGIRRAVEQRDGHCVFAGCTAPAAWCDVHHVVHWTHGGPTSCDNGALVCERHHTALHEGGFSIHREPGTAVWHTYRPDGSEIRVRGPGAVPP